MGVLFPHNRAITICRELLEHQTETILLLAVTITMVLVPSLVKIVLPCGSTCYGVLGSIG